MNQFEFTFEFLVYLKNVNSLVIQRNAFFDPIIKLLIYQTKNSDITCPGPVRPADIAADCWAAAAAAAIEAALSDP